MQAYVSSPRASPVPSSPVPSSPVSPRAETSSLPLSPGKRGPLTEAAELDELFAMGIGTRRRMGEGTTPRTPARPRSPAKSGSTAKVAKKEAKPSPAKPSPAKPSPAKPSPASVGKSVGNDGGAKVAKKEAGRKQAPASTAAASAAAASAADVAREEAQAARAEAEAAKKELREAQKQVKAGEVTTAWRVAAAKSQGTADTSAVHGVSSHAGEGTAATTPKEASAAPTRPPAIVPGVNASMMDVPLDIKGGGTMSTNTTDTANSPTDSSTKPTNTAAAKGKAGGKMAVLTAGGESAAKRAAGVSVTAAATKAEAERESARRQAAVKPRAPPIPTASSVDNLMALLLAQAAAEVEADNLLGHYA